MREEGDWTLILCFLLLFNMKISSCFFFINISFCICMLAFIFSLNQCADMLAVTGLLLEKLGGLCAPVIKV